MGSSEIRRAKPAATTTEAEAAELKLDHIPWRAVDVFEKDPRRTSSHDRTTNEGPQIGVSWPSATRRAESLARPSRRHDVHTSRPSSEVVSSDVISESSTSPQCREVADQTGARNSSGLDKPDTNVFVSEGDLQAQLEPPNTGTEREPIHATPQHRAERPDRVGRFMVASHSRHQRVARSRRVTRIVQPDSSAPCSREPLEASLWSPWPRIAPASSLRSGDLWGRLRAA